MTLRPVLAVTALATVAWLVESRWDLYAHQHLTDIPVYDSTASSITEGQVPYRDFTEEYPPLAVGLMVVARVLPGATSAGFSLLMLIALVATAIGVMATARALGMSRVRQLAAGGVVALVPLLLGDFVATRFDLAVAAALAWTAWAAASRRFWLAWTILGVAVALKLTPVVIAPLLYLWHRRHAHGPAPARGAGVAAGLVALTFLPFVAIAPSGVWDMFAYHLDRPLQIESLGGAYLLGLHALAGIPLRVETTFGSQNLVGSGPEVIAAISTALMIAAVAAVCVTFALLVRRADAQHGARMLVTAMAAALVATVATGKVLSPQFVLWLVPVCLLVSGAYARHAFAGTVAVLLATQLYFPSRYWDLVALETGPIALLVIRDALLVALVAFCWPRPGLLQPATDGVSSPRAPRRDPARSIPQRG